MSDSEERKDESEFSDLLCFDSLGQFTVNGNDVFAVLNDRECHNFDHLIGCNIKIDGDTRKVIGVERFTHSPPWHKGEKISLMCELQENEFNTIVINQWRKYHERI